ncbi:MAG: hypothetical protein JO040_09495 [Gemmatimonadetes bacterium]|nr:hypothetical protein [Gemmatimonadota bacterium]
MARRANYGFEKRQKEMDKQKKKEEKAEKKRLRKEAGGSDLDELTGEGAVPEGDDEDDADSAE